jgi:redox-sensing transcriptional repressor
MERSSGSDRPLPEPTVARLPLYLRIAEESLRAGTTTISSEELARAGGINSAKVRKDLSLLGSLGTRGTGYDAASLVMAIDEILGVTRDWPVVIAGVGNLGRALVNARGFFTGGYRLVGIVDADPSLLGTMVGTSMVETFEAIEQRLDSPPAIGVITTPAEAAQDAAQALVRLGVRSILNFAPRFLEVPSDVHVRYVDLSMELQILSYHATLGREDEQHDVASVSPIRSVASKAQGT